MAAVASASMSPPAPEGRLPAAGDPGLRLARGSCPPDLYKFILLHVSLSISDDLCPSCLPMCRSADRSGDRKRSIEHCAHGKSGVKAPSKVMGSL